jgi:nucleoside 2-deoxyribosyltransferase
MQYDYFLICPVRNATKKQNKQISELIQTLEAAGKTVYYPARDTNQVDRIGFRICADNRTAMENSNEVLLYYDPASSGTLFDLGMAFSMRKKITILYYGAMEPTPKKSFTNMILHWHNVRGQ